VNEPPTVEEKEIEKNILELLLAYVRPPPLFEFIHRLISVVVLLLLWA